MKTLLDILTNPSKRMPLETLLKCEAVLEKLDLKRVTVHFSFEVFLFSCGKCTSLIKLLGKN